MEALSVQEIASIRSSCPPQFAGWVFVSSLATKTYKKTPLARRWCEVRSEEARSPKSKSGGLVLEFYREMADVEPTKRVHLSSARVVVSRSSKLTSAQVAQIPNRDSARLAFYIDFVPESFNTVETRRGSSMHNSLGFVLVASDSVQGWESILIAGCRRSVPQERRRQKVQRWINRAWLRVKGGWEEDGFDAKPISTGDEFFSLVPPSRARPVALERLRFSVDTAGSACEDDDEEEEDEGSFMTAGSDSSDEEKDSRQATPHAYAPGTKFATLAAMFAEKNESIRHATPICESELDSVVEFVLSTKSFSLTTPPPEWSMCSSDETFDCFKSIDGSTGIFRTRTWAKLVGVVPQTLFYILYDRDARKAWDHHYCKFESEWTDPADQDLDILDACVSAPLGCANREFLEWRRKKVPHNQDEPFVIYLRSWDAPPPGRPAARGAVRAEVWLSGYLILPLRVDNVLVGSQVLVFTQIDIKGLIPKYVVNALSSSAPKKWVRGVTTAALAEIESRGIPKEALLRMSHSERNTLYGLK